MIEVDGIWLRTIGDKVQVLVEVRGTWRIAIEENGWPKKEGLISHIAEPRGIKNWPHDKESPKEARDRHNNPAG